MKKIFVLASITILSACNSKEPAKTDTVKIESDSTMAINSPYPILYSSKFEMGDPKNAETVLQLWKVWDDGDLSKSKDMFADTVQLYLADGSIMKGPRDSVMAGAQQYRNSLGSSSSVIHAVTDLKSTDKNENWALVWGMEKDTDKKGKVDSFFLQETWRFNKDGKADVLHQFRAAGSPPKMPPAKK